MYSWNWLFLKNFIFGHLIIVPTYSVLNNKIFWTVVVRNDKPPRYLVRETLKLLYKQLVVCTIVRSVLWFGQRCISITDLFPSSIKLSVTPVLYGLPLDLDLFDKIWLKQSHIITYCYFLFQNSVAPEEPNNCRHRRKGRPGKFGFCMFFSYEASAPRSNRHSRSRLSHRMDDVTCRSRFPSKENFFVDISEIWRISENWHIETQIWKENGTPLLQRNFNHHCSQPHDPNSGLPGIRVSCGDVSVSRDELRLRDCKLEAPILGVVSTGTR